MTTFSIVKEQHINADLDTVWDFFSNPANLAIITPPDMDFVTTSTQLTDHIYTGQIITYMVTPMWGVRLSWMTEITHVHDKKLFVDEQRKGPYKLWHHQHHFEATENGVLMTDIVHYALPFSIFGLLAHALFVKRRIKDIFDYRYKKVESLFNKK